MDITSHQSKCLSSKNPQTINAGEGVERRNSYTVGKLVQALWRTVWRLHKKLNIELPYDTSTTLLGIYLEKKMVSKDTCTTMFTSALFTIAKTWKQPKCPLTEKWIKKMWYIYTMEYYSAVK